MSNPAETLRLYTKTGFWIFVAFMVITLAFLLFKRKTPQAKEYFSNLFTAGAFLVLPRYLASFVFMTYLGGLVYEAVPWKMPGGWGTVALAFVLTDLLFYWFHRLNHRSRVFWVLHHVHHSSPHLDISTAVREQFLKVFDFQARAVLLCALGVPVGISMACSTLMFLYLTLVHVNLPFTFGPLEGYLNSMSAHRVHHGKNPRYVNKNYAAVFALWDRLFGSYEPENEAVNYGVSDAVESSNPWLVQYIPVKRFALGYRGVKGFRNIVLYTFGPPELKFEDKTITSKESL